ncbi:cyclic nucleotide-binding and patatin-like phospholipase domain-containing protein [Geomesophilobacter sediminis]|uniref:Patatin-like phospholipase family protein n=1 Tax=Geomesophilobacter sediminis TaxID=2798584 RepID=A0A8J7JA37_9BACT|nr:cyclic nucleotide-binding and patatin-like phospholipase domain-containing protein [Geomesophilobacter sediminis]MBJ6723651.1 patatin-like phospholipase family protein [Geomesophilobacter sediminis]
MQEVDASIPEICAALLKIEFLSFLPDEELNCLAGQFTRVRSPKGTVLCRAGERGDTLFVIASGLVRVSVQEGGTETLLAELKRGDFFGEYALLTGEPRKATAKAVLDVELFVLRKEDFETLLYNQPKVAYHVSRIVSSRNLTGATQRERIPPPCYFSIIPSNDGLGCSSFVIRLAQVAACETRQRTLVVDFPASGGELVRELGGERIPCPDSRLIEEFSREITRRQVGDAWYGTADGVTVFQLPGEDRRLLLTDLSTSLSALLELLKHTFSLVLLVLPPELTPVSRRVLQLSEGVLYLISNRPEELGAVEEKLARIREIIEPHTVQLKIGTSHVQAGKGLFRSEIRQRLNLGEMPQVWWSTQEEKRDRVVCALAREICRRRVGVVLGSGASRGWAHLGVLRALERNGIPIDLIAGCSIGALIGSLYAKTGSADAAIDLCLSYFSTLRQVKRNIFDYCITGGGVLKGHRILTVLQEMLDGADFFDLKVPLSVIAVDMATGRQVVLDEGSVSQAVRASISSPGIFRPYLMQGTWYTDGALVNPLPVDVIINKGANFVLASVVEKGVAEEWPGDGSPSLLNTLARSFSIMFARTTRDRAGGADVTIYPEVAGYSWGDFYQGKELIQKGEEATLKRMDEIERLILRGEQEGPWQPSVP